MVRWETPFHPGLGKSVFSYFASHIVAVKPCERLPIFGSAGPKPHIPPSRRLNIERTAGPNCRVLYSAHKSLQIAEGSFRGHPLAPANGSYSATDLHQETSIIGNKVNKGQKQRSFDTIYYSILSTGMDYIIL